MPSEEYRQHAAECLRIAENLGDPQGRAGLIAMDKRGCNWHGKPRKI
jgi:hypothetical protein